MRNKKYKWWIYIFIFIAFTVGGYRSYREIEYSRTHGVYTIAVVKKERVARNGWKVSTTLSFRNKTYQFDGIVDWEVFSIHDTSKRFFAKISENMPIDGYFLVPVIEVPDSIQFNRPAGWSEEWMKEHFPKVVEYIHDTPK